VEEGVWGGEGRPGERVQKHIAIKLKLNPNPGFQEA